MSIQENKDIPKWDILTTTNTFNIKIFYALIIMATVYLLNIVLTFSTVINNNNDTLENNMVFFMVGSVFSYIFTIMAIYLAHKGLKTIQTTHEKGRFFGYGVLTAGYISLFTIGLVFLVMDVMYIMLMLK